MGVYNGCQAASVRGERRREGGVEGVREKRRERRGEKKREGGSRSTVPVWAQRVQDGVLRGRSSSHEDHREQLMEMNPAELLIPSKKWDFIF